MISGFITAHANVSRTLSDICLPFAAALRFWCFTTPLLVKCSAGKLDNSSACDAASSLRTGVMSCPCAGRQPGHPAHQGLDTGRRGEPPCPALSCRTAWRPAPPLAAAASCHARQRTAKPRRRPSDAAVPSPGPAPGVAEPGCRAAAGGLRGGRVRRGAGQHALPRHAILPHGCAPAFAQPRPAAAARGRPQSRG